MRRLPNLVLPMLLLPLCLVVASVPALARGPVALRVTVDGPGIFRVADAFSIERPGDGYGLFRDGVSAPFFVAEDGSIVFEAAPPLPRYSKQIVFMLRPAREGEKVAPRLGGAPKRTPLAWIEENAHYDPLETNEVPLLERSADREPCDYFYFGEAKAKQAYKLPWKDGTQLAAGAAEAKVRVVLQGRRRAAASNGVDLKLNGQVLGKVRWTGAKPHTFETKLDPTWLKAENELKLDVFDGKVCLDRVEVEGIELESTIREARVEPAFTSRTDFDCDYVAIVAPAFADAVKPLLEHRQKQGLKTMLVDVQNVCDRFADGTFTPRAIRDYLAVQKPRFVLLVGESGYDVEWLLPREVTVPTALVDTYDNGASASDNWFVAGSDDDPVPFAAIGRFPVRTVEECNELVDRTIRYETTAEVGPWRRRLSFVAGEGRFGEAIDKAIEDMFARIVGDAVPYDYDINLTYASAASPYLYPPEKLSDKVVDRMNEGAVILDYIGHGHVEGFDSLRWKGKRYPIFAFEDVPKVAAPKRPPIVLITACWTGCFDDPSVDAVGERLFEQKDGAVAVFAATRISHPYANAILSKELVGALFGGAAGPDGPRLGERLALGKKHLIAPEKVDEYRSLIDQTAVLFLQSPALMKRLLWDDAHLFTLLGDPALVPAFPRGSVALEVVGGEAVPGEKATVRGKAEGLGGVASRAIVTLEVSRKTIRGEIQPVELGKQGAEKKVLENYELANDKVVVRVEGPVAADGSFEATLDLPEDLIPAQKHYLKAYCWNEKSDAAGSIEVALGFGDEDDGDGGE